MIKSDDDGEEHQQNSRGIREAMSDDEEPSHAAGGMSDGGEEVMDEIEELSWP